jgi:hypothetical protein
MSRSRRWRTFLPKFPASIVFFTALALIVVLLPVLYVSHEHYFYFWDWVAYQNKATSFVSTWRQSPTEAIQQLQASLASNYNLLYVVPLLPFLLAFGKSRLVFIVSLALVYLLPFSLVMGAIATKLIPIYPRAVFWSTAFLTLLVPAVWAPLLRGYPDIGGILLISLAVLAYLQDVKLKHWWQIPLMGFLLGASALFRRHFAYSAIAFFGAMTLQYLLVFSAEVQLNLRRAWQHLLKSIVQISLIAAISFATLITFAWKFTYRALTVDYGTLHAAWSLTFSDVVQRYASFYGWVVWMLVILGFSAGILTRRVNLPATTFIVLFGTLGLIEWLVILRYGYIHYTLHITPFVVLGIASFIWTAWSTFPGKVGTLMLGAASLYLVCNVVMGLTPMGTFTNSVRPLFAANFSPLVRQDYDEVLQLVNYLRQLAPNREPISVVAASSFLNPSVVTTAEQTLYGREESRLNVLRIPEIDSRDFYPLEQLLQAKYVVVPIPFQQILPTDEQVVRSGEQDVVKVVFDAFTQNWEIAQDFKPLPVEFTLSNNVTVNLYQRTHPTVLETAVRTFDAMQQQIGEQPGLQIDWMLLSQPLDKTSISKNPDNTYRVVISPGDRDSLPFDQQDTISFLYLGSLPENVEVTGTVMFRNNCAQKSSLRLTLLNQRADTISSIENQYSPDNSSRFKLAIRGQNPAYLLLEVLRDNKNDLIDDCALEINSLAVLTQNNQ